MRFARFITKKFYWKGNSMFASLHTSTLAVDRVQSRNARSGMASWVIRAASLRAERKQLATLDDARLRDIGMTKDQALAEAARPIWDVPRGWRV